MSKYEEARLREHICRETEDFNPYYHTTADTLAAINLASARQSVQAVVGTVAQMG